MRQGKVTVVVGGQFGSEGKGHMTAQFCREGPVAAVRVAGPNAGHSVIDPRDGHRWALRCIPVAAVVNPEARLIIAAGSEIDPEVLFDEVDRLEASGISVRRRLFIDGQATVIHPQHRVDEKGLTDRIGSTGKGIGAARAERIMRRGQLWESFADNHRGDLLRVPTDTAQMLASWLGTGRDVVIEGTQGYGLGLHAGYYPYCTSSDCRAVDFLAMAGITPWAPWVKKVETVVVLRTFPIRVAGDSGPLADETDWETLHAESQGHIMPELTTVTQKVRRVGRWDAELAARAIDHNGGRRARVALTMFDYWFPELFGVTDASQFEKPHWDALVQLSREIGADICWVGTGPSTMVSNWGGGNG